MAVSIERQLDEPERRRLVQLYLEAFEPLRTLTATKQTLDEEEFLALLDYDATTVFASRDREGQLNGVAIGVNDLKLIPWINPEFFFERFPEHYATGRLAYMPAFLVDPRYQKGTTLYRLAGFVASFYGDNHFVLAMDCCLHNIEVEHLPSVLERAASRFTPTVLHELDHQAYFAYELGD